MDVKRCFDPSCMLDVEYFCPCTSPQTYSCEVHLGKHLKLPNRTHNFDTFFSEPCEGTKEAILEALTKENSKNSKLKGKILASFSQRFFESKNDLEELMKSFDSTSDIISNCFSKVSEASKISKSEQDPILELLSLQPNDALEKLKLVIQNNSDLHNSAKIFCGFSQKIEQMIELFIKDKFEAHLDKRLSKIENTLDEHDKYIHSEHTNFANITKNTISEIINENKKCKQEFEDWKEEINRKLINETTLLNSKLSDIIEDLNRKLKQLEISQNTINIFSELRDSKLDILNSPPCLETEMIFREICSKYESNISEVNPQVMQAYQDYTSLYNKNAFLYNQNTCLYNKNTCLYNLTNLDNNANLLIYNTETESQDLIILKNQQLNYGTCLTQIPDGKVFCFGKYEDAKIIKYFHGNLRTLIPKGIALIIDKNGKVNELSYETLCNYSSCTKRPLYWIILG